MTWIQQVCWRLEMDYLGHPYYVSGNAIYHALGQRLPSERHAQIHASHGIFAPGQFGMYPETHSQIRAHPSLGSVLPDVETYDDLFLHRYPVQAWLVDSRPRDALNTHDIRTQSGHPALAYQMRFGKPASAQSDVRKTTWFVHAYLYADEPGVLPLEDGTLTGLQFGGKRNYGYGVTCLHDSQMVDLDRLDYSRIEDADEYRIELLTPFVLRSEYPNTNDVDVPNWWDRLGPLRRRRESIVEGADQFDVTTVDHGQHVTYTGSNPVETAKARITRVGTHSKYGFGELRVVPKVDGE